jgi:hypothetical protein
VAEGPRKQLEAFLGQVESTMSAHIHERSEETPPATGEFHGFAIRY